MIGCSDPVGTGRDVASCEPVCPVTGSMDPVGLFEVVCDPVGLTNDVVCMALVVVVGSSNRHFQADVVFR